MKYIILLSFCMAALISCHKAEDTKPIQADVFIAGYGYADDSPETIPLARYWKNGLPVDLTDGFETAIAKSIFVSGNDVYVAGYEACGDSTYALYWKNGIPVTLPCDLTYTFAESVFVSGEDVYVTGWGIGARYNQVEGSEVSRYWKNGVLIKLTDDTKFSRAFSVTVSDNDVYIAGFETDEAGYMEAKYWKNGVAVNLTEGFQVHHAYANSIIISGDDVYATGVVMGGLMPSNPIATYWKNGVATYLTDGSKQADAKSIVVSGNDVFVAGSESDIAKYWKNGTAIEITESPESSTCANSISVFEDKIYIAGSQFLHLNNKARYWGYNISSDPISVTLSDGEAFSIYLSKN